MLHQTENLWTLIDQCWDHFLGDVFIRKELRNSSIIIRSSCVASHGILPPDANIHSAHTKQEAS